MHVAFDIGNVLCEVNLQPFIQALQPYISSDAAAFTDFIQPMHDIGMVTMRGALYNYFHFAPEIIDELLQAWNSTVKPNEMMLRFLENLKHQGIKIAFLSNIGVEHATYLKKICPELFHSNKEHLSYLVGARKPTKLYYQSFLMDNHDFVGAIFVDDREENLRAGKAYSFKSFKFSLEDILKQPANKQKIELDKIKSFILNRKFDAGGPKYDWEPPPDLL